MKYIFIALILLNSLLYSQDKEKISDIENYTLEILEKIENSHYITREFYIENATIPAIGQPLSKMIVHYEQDYDDSHYLIETPIAIENYYQFAGNISLEIYILYHSENSFYYSGKCGFGSINDVENCDWNYEDTYIFYENKLIFYKSQLDTYDIDNDLIQKKAIRRLEQFKTLFEIINNMNIPSPPIFKEYFLGDS